jgi:SSS family solute:Na+ symporter
VYKAGFNPKASDETVMRLSRFLVLVITTLALVFAIAFPEELVNLLIYGYDGVCQFFPGVVLGLFWRRVTKTGVFSGLIVGIAVVGGLIASGHDPFLGMNAGFVGLAINSAVTFVVCLWIKPKTVKRQRAEEKHDR